ncbi:MAG: hypothetical protein WC701_12400 [Kiritimatiellales bacterium]
MKPTNKTALFLPLTVCLFLSFCKVANAESPVNFTLTLNRSVDPGATYTGFHEAGKGTHDVYDIGFQVAINSVNGTNVYLSPIAAFCCELQQDISTYTYTFLSQNLYKLSADEAGMAGTASSGIPTGGIGAQRAAYVSYLFDRYYISEALTGWTCTPTNPFTQAFQLALWEMTHDSDMNLTNTSGSIYVGTQAGTQQNNAISLATTMLQDVYSANISSSYISTNFDICALTHPQYQDIILATKKGSYTSQTLEPLITLPEPNVQTLMSMVAGFFWIVSRVRRHLYQ